jgi:hypothetical protein
VGMKRTLGVVSPQTVNGVTYEFSSWSDGGAATHEITTPSADTTYTATFLPVADTVKPAVAVTRPAAGATVGGTVNLAANASDASGLTKVEWWVDGVRVATDTDGAPWTKPWNSATVADGTHKIFAKARDTAGNWGASLSVTFSVSQTAPPPDTTAPTVSVTAPAAAATVSGTAATLSATASDNVAVTSIRWLVDGVEVAADTNGSPWTATWNSTTVANGAHTVAARAADAAGNLRTSAGVSFTVSNPPVGGTLFSNGFENGSFSAWSTVRTGADGTATVQTPAAKTGTYGAQLTATANTGSFAYARKTIALQTELTVSGDFRVTQEGVSGGDVVFFRLLDPTGARVASLKRQNLDRDKLRVSIGSTGFDTTGRLALNTWARLELHVVVAGTGVSTVEVRLNGTTVYQNTTASLGYEGIATVQIGNDTARQAFTLHADNIKAVTPAS